jgi:hypothetical protein
MFTWAGKECIMTIMGACLVAIGLLTVIWGVIETHGVDMTNLDFLSFFTGGIIVMALGVCLIPALPPVGKVAGIWLAGVAIAWYMGCMDMELIVKLMSFVVIAGLAAWITTKLI